MKTGRRPQGLTGATQLRYPHLMSLTPGTRLGSYEILAPIGTGGMGEVYRAKDTRLGREVAVKVLPADVASDGARLARFEHEARTVASLLKRVGCEPKPGKKVQKAISD